MLKTILVVDDNKQNRELLKLIIRRAGFRALEAENGEDAVDMAKGGLPDLIFMDIQLPVMDGVQAARMIKSDPGTAHIPIIAFTSYAMKGDKERLLACGFEGYIAKPVKVEEVTELLNKRIAPEG